MAAPEGAVGATWRRRRVIVLSAIPLAGLVPLGIASAGLHAPGWIDSRACGEAAASALVGAVLLAGFAVSSGRLVLHATWLQALMAWKGIPLLLLVGGFACLSAHLDLLEAVIGEGETGAWRDGFAGRLVVWAILLPAACAVRLGFIVVRRVAGRA